jgi:hypothetical protein
MKAVGNNRAQDQIIEALTKAAEAAGPAKRTTQLVSAFGERAVEAELLRRGWVTANINASIRNAKDFDLFAVKNTRSLHIRVKTCSPKKDIQYGFRKGQEITTDDIAGTDFTVIVRMGEKEKRNQDRFYVVPSRVVLEALDEWRRAALTVGRPGSKGPQKDIGLWVLRWRELRSGQSQPNYGFEKKWDKYLDGWDLLDR